MTGAEWEATTDYLALLIYLRGEGGAEEHAWGVMPGLHCAAGRLPYGPAQRTSSRKLRLVAAAISRKWWDVPHDEPSRSALLAYQSYLNESGTWGEFEAAVMRVQDAVQRGEGTSISHLATLWDDTPYGTADMAMQVACAVAYHVAEASVAVTCKDATEDDWFGWSFGGGPPDPLWQSTRTAVESEYCPLLREIIGNPFRPVAFSPEWRTDTAVALAEQMYASGDFGAMPILADALQDAGCEDADILGHCRGGGPHVQGCWVVDALLGRSEP